MLAGKGMKRIHRICSGTVGSALMEMPSAKSRFSGRQGANIGRSCIEHTVNVGLAMPPDAKTALRQAFS